MITQTGNNVVAYTRKKGQVRPVELRHEFGLSETGLHKQLAKLLNQGRLEKFGTTPKVYYRVADESSRKKREAAARAFVGTSKFDGTHSVWGSKEAVDIWLREMREESL